MLEADAIKMIKDALNAVSPGMGNDVNFDSDLQKDGLLDSLDIMNFMFELELLYGKKLEQITDTFDDYRISTLVNFMTTKY